MAAESWVQGTAGTVRAGRGDAKEHVPGSDSTVTTVGRMSSEAQRHAHMLFRTTLLFLSLSCGAVRMERDALGHLSSCSVPFHFSHFFPARSPISRAIKKKKAHFCFFFMELITLATLAKD